MLLDFERLKTVSKGFGLDIEENRLEMFDAYAKALISNNKKHNLTAITQPDEILIKHIADSLTLLPVIRGLFESSDGIKIVDVGTGAGFPGIVLAICMPEARVTLVDSIGKKVEFLRGVCRELGLSCRCLVARAEEMARGEYREGFDLVVSRAVSELPKLCELCLPLARIGGFFAAMKGCRAEEEVESAQNASAAMGACHVKTYRFMLDEEAARGICVYKKCCKTDEGYPRRWPRIDKSPL